MDAAFAAGWFVFLKRAETESFCSIVEQFAAVMAEYIPEVMMGPAVDGDHGANGGQLTLHFFFFFHQIIQLHPLSCGKPVPVIVVNSQR